MLEENELAPKVRGVENELQKVVTQDFILVGTIYEADEISPRGHNGSPDGRPSALLPVAVGAPIILCIITDVEDSAAVTAHTTNVDIPVRARIGNVSEHPRPP